MEPLLLASTSPRRAELLASLGLSFEIFRPLSPELPLPVRLSQLEIPSRLEAVALAKGREGNRAFPHRLVISADTVVYAGGKILGKPTDEVDAAAMLASLSGRRHSVLTAVAVHQGEKVASAVETTRVRFRALTSQEIADYVATGEPADKAGAYGIQGLGGFLVADIQGRHDNVVGLPMLTLYTLLLKFGVDLLRESRA